MEDDARARNMQEKLERIIRAHNPDLDELYNTLEELKRQGALLKQAEQKPSLTSWEKQITDRVEETWSNDAYLWWGGIAGTKTTFSGPI